VRQSMVQQFDPPRFLPKIRTRENSELTTEAVLKSGLFRLSDWFRPTKNQTDQTNQPDGLPTEGAPQ
jgi:hypothetical protein